MVVSVLYTKYVSENVSIAKNKNETLLYNIDTEI